MYIHTHTMCVDMDDVRKSSFLCDVSMVKLFVLDSGLKIVNVHGYGDVRKYAFLCDVFMAKLLLLERWLKIVIVQCT